MKNIIYGLIWIVCTVLGFQLQAQQPQLIRQELSGSTNKPTIAFKQYQLSNGLQVLLHEDHSDPVVYVDVTYHVGSAREQSGRSGFAHFFEHMMFQGSKNVADEQHFKIITEAGGTLNGTTNSDRTNYFETVPSNQLEKMLWLEADRMGFLLDSVTQLKFEVQRATVKNERGQRYDNAPNGLVSEKIGEALYPQGHPYSWTTIGYIEDLNRVDVNDLKRFYLRWYGAKNAVLTLSGDFNTDSCLKWIQMYFGSIPAGPEVSPMLKNPVVLNQNRYISYTDNVKFPMLVFAFPSAPAYSNDDAALDALAQILAGSQSSPFYKDFIECKKAVSANAFQYSRELAGQFEIRIRANAGSNLKEIETQLKNTLMEWAKRGPSDDDVKRFKAQYRSNLWNQLNTVQGKGSLLASYHTLAGDAYFLNQEYQHVNDITKEDIRRVFERYIFNQPAVILSCVPKSKPESIASTDTWTLTPRIIEPEREEYKKLTYSEPKDGFNRSLMPPVSLIKPVSVPAVTQTLLWNRIPCIYTLDQEIPKTTIALHFAVGHRYESASKAGLAQLCARMLTQSTEHANAKELESRLERIGASIRSWSNDDEITLQIQAETPYLNEALGILEDYLKHPKFDPIELELERKQMLDAYVQSMTTASAMADMAFRLKVYGNTIMGLPTGGTSETLKALQISDVKEVYQSMGLENLSISMCGSENFNVLETQLAFLKTFQKGKKMQYQEINYPLSQPIVYFLDKPQAAQSEIRVGRMSLPYDANGDFFKAQVANFAFAGAFNSRVNYILREVKGWTYGTRGSFNGNRFKGPYVISGGFKSNATDSTLKVIVQQFKLLNDSGLNASEMEFAKNALLQSEALKYESQSQKLGFIKRIQDYKLSVNYTLKQNQVLKQLQLKELNAIARKHLNFENMFIIVVADKSTTFEKVKAIGLPVQEIDIYGKVKK